MDGMKKVPVREQEPKVRATHIIPPIRIGIGCAIVTDFI